MKKSLLLFTVRKSNRKSNRLWSAFLLIALFISLTGANVFAQKQISGQVTAQSDGYPLPGVNILVKGTSTGAITDFHGKYTLTVNSDDEIIVFSFVGYKTVEVPIGDKTTINIELEEDVAGLDEIVVVGYGTMKKSDVSGAIVSIKEDDYQQVKTTNVVEALQGKAAGVDITRTSGEAGSGFSILIRGNRTLSGSNTPLYIVDGIQYGSNIDINPNDIASIEILKDVSSTAIYGAKGANGVIIITTKRGEAGKSRISFSAYAGINKPLGEIPYMNAAEYIQYKEDLARFEEYSSSGEWVEDVDVTYEEFEEEGIANGTDTKWLDLIMQDSYIQNYYLSASGGRKGMTYSVSADCTDELGFLQQDEFKRYVLKAGMDVEVNDRVKVGFNAVLRYTDRDRMDFPEKSLRLMNPLAEPYDSAGNLVTNPMSSSTQQTPLWYYQDGYYTEQELSSRIFSSVYTDIKIFNGLIFRSTFNASITSQRNGLFEQAGEDDVNVNIYISPGKSYTWNNILTFSRSFGVHSLGFTAVHEMIAGNTEQYNISGINPSISNSLWYALDGMDEISVSLDGDDYFTESSQVAFLCRINYTMAGKYTAQASLRYDGASRLAEGNKWDYFPAASVAWNVSEENFIKQVNAISLLKLRLGFGTSGNYSVPEYSSVSSVNSSPLYYEFGTDETVSYGYRPSTSGNAELGWEKTSSYNIGVDFGLFNNRISGNIDLYIAKTTDLLQQRTLPAHAAISYIYDNVGETQTKGVEVMLHTINVTSPRANAFTWTTDFSVTANKEEIVELASGVDKDEANGWFVGEPVNIYYNYEQEGIWQEDEEEEMALYEENDFQVGDFKLKDINGDYVIDEDDRVVIGQTNPKWFASFTNRFSYMGFDLSIMIMGRFGHTIQDKVYSGIQVRDVYAESGYAVDYWTPENRSNDLPRLDPSISAINYMPYYSCMLYTDGSWIKVRDITLGYNFSAAWLAQVKISSARLYLSAKNTFVLYSPLYDRGRYDPEKRGSVSWPIPKTFIAGITIDF